MNYMDRSKINRRTLIKKLGLYSGLLCLPQSILAREKNSGAQQKAKQKSATPQKKLLSKTIPSSGSKISAIGMGTWITFNVGSNTELRDQRTQVLKKFFELGGELIDSSPMYGSAQSVLGYSLDKLAYPKKLFVADKIWTQSTDEGPKQYQEIKNLWGVKKADLMQIHNLLNWQDHLKYLQRLKSEGEIKYLGITTSHGRRHEELEAIMKSHSLDFVQLTYNITHREAESRLLKVAKDRGIAVIANRPYDGGNLMSNFKSKKLPAIATEAGIKSWAELFLKWIISHPTVTLAIPATSKVQHMVENMKALEGDFFSPELRKALSKGFS